MSAGVILPTSGAVLAAVIRIPVPAGMTIESAREWMAAGLSLSAALVERGATLEIGALAPPREQ